MTFGEKVISFYSTLEFTGVLPAGISIMNPIRDNPLALDVTRNFYKKFYSDHDPRILILGINPGRFGAGTTGIPFTDTIRLNEKCQIPFDAYRTYETSSVFVYELIEAFGGVNAFYGKFFVSAICPLGFTRQNSKGKSVNYNYYDSRALTDAVYGFILESLEKQVDLGIDTSVCYCLGTGRNENFLRRLNDRCRIFKTIIGLEHPRYIMQYKSKQKQHYIGKYLAALNHPNNS
jgi:hypothetical protein